MQNTVVTESAGSRVLTWTLLPVGCAVLAWLVQLLAGWLVTWRYMLWRGLLEFVASIPAQWVVGVGLVLGLGLAARTAYEGLTATVDDEAVTLRSSGRVSTFRRDEVSAVFLDRKQLVLLGSDTAELDRRPGERNRERLAGAFRAHGYPWADADPHAEEYRRWVDDLPGLPEGANVLLATRQKNLKSADAEQLRGELARLGVLVRDEDGRQYWRPVPR